MESERYEIVQKQGRMGGRWKGTVRIKVLSVKGVYHDALLCINCCHARSRWNDACPNGSCVNK